MATPLPRTLSPLAGRLSGAASCQPAVEFISATWRRWLTASAGIGGAGMRESDVDELLHRFPKQNLSRSDIRELAVDRGSVNANRDLFIASMIWGRGKSNGRIMPYITTALRSKSFDYGLTLSAKHVAEGDLEAAHRCWQLPGLREPFFTKWFWATGFRPHAGPAALVLDGRVWRTLSALKWNSINVANSTRRAKRYMAYVQTAHAWAGELTRPNFVVTAEDVEFALFYAAGDLQRFGDLPLMVGT